MSKQKFQTGDLVKVVSGKSRGLTGKIVKYFKHPLSSRGYYIIRTEDEKRAYCYSYELNKAEEPHKFKVGDKVMFSEKAKKWFDQNSITYDPRDIYTISKKEKDGVYYLEYMPNYCFDEDDLELAKNIEFKVGDYVETKYGCMDNERTVKLTLEKAKEWYKKGGELKEVALQAYREEELRDKPRSWEEFCKNYKMTGNEYFIDDNADILSVIPEWDMCKNTQNAKNILPNREYAYAFLALMQLINLRKAWIGDWKPNYYMNMASNWGIEYEPNPGVFSVENHCKTNGGCLTFPRKEMALEFLDCFRDLCETAKILL